MAKRGFLGVGGRRRTLVKPFSPDTLSNLVRWYKADAITGLVNNDAVGSWVDSTGNSNATQGTAANKPTYKTAVQNSLPGVQFDGTNDSLAFTAPSLTGDFTIFSVFKSSVDTCILSAGGTNQQWRINRSGSNVISLYGAASGAAAEIISGTLGVAINSVCTFAWKRASGVAELRQNGTAYSYTGTTPTDTMLPSTIGMVVSLLWLNGYVFEILIYSRALNSTEVGQVESYLKTKWGHY